MKIRQAVKNDSVQLKSLFLENQKYTQKFDKEVVVNEQTEKEIEKDIEGIFKEPNNQIFVAEENKKIVGFIIANFSPGVIRSGWLEEIFITSSFRKRGIGFKLMVKSIDWLKQKGAKKVELRTHKLNQEALSFHQKLGFKKQPAKFVRLEKKLT
ncbi:GNAT family N-acetyltransferase [Patescibacteria group bacterium]|nr:GNAT family N-acetyltransferase [Patescibacteria group bacterium]